MGRNKGSRGENVNAEFLRNFAGVGDGSKVNWDNIDGKMSEEAGPYKIGRFLKDPEF
jgi:hypothetical protein